MQNAHGTRYVMGTFLTVRVQGDDAKKVRAARDCIFNEVQRLDERLSIYRTDSEISWINQAAGFAPVRVSRPTYAVIDQALRYAHLSAGAFDPTLGSPLNYRHVLLNSTEQSVFLSAPGMRLDLGGIGKGFALDCALDRAKTIDSLTQIVIDFGGQLLFWTADGACEPLRVGIENPVHRNAVLSTLEIRSNASLSTSSNAEHDGHLRDPRNGKPVEAIASVTVLAPTGTEAEALSTALFVLKPTERAALLEQCPGARAYVFTADHEVRFHVMPLVRSLYLSGAPASDARNPRPQAL